MNNWDELAEIVKGWQNINAVMYNTCKVSAINDCTADWVSMGIEFDALFDFLKSNRYCPADSQLVPLCDDKPYNPETHFCYINKACGHRNACDDPTGRTCPDISCIKKEEIWEKCNGNEYDPYLEECYNRDFVACRGQVSDCGGCVKHTTCDGKLVLRADGSPMELCWERLSSCGDFSN